MSKKMKIIVILVMGGLYSLLNHHRYGIPSPEIIPEIVKKSVKRENQSSRTQKFEPKKIVKSQKQNLKRQISPSPLPSPPSFLTLQKIEKRRIEIGKYLIGFVLKNVGGKGTLHPEISCQILPKRKKGSGWGAVLWHEIWKPSGAIDFQSQEEKTYFFPLPHQEVDLRPGHYLTECILEDQVVSSEFTVPPDFPLLELTQVVENQKGLSLQIRNWGLAYQPLPFAVDCKVAPGTGPDQIVWQDVLETTSPFPVGTLLDFPLISLSEVMGLSPGAPYLVQCEFLPSPLFESKNKNPLVHHFRAPASL